MKRQIWPAIAIGVIAVLMVVLWLNRNDNSASTDVSYQGVVACLPPNTKQETITLLCAIGLKTDDGQYYSLDTSELDNPMITYANDTRIQVEGRLEAVDKDLANEFAAAGVVVVTKVTPL